MTRCPACIGWIRAEARKCRHCHAWLEPDPTADAGEWTQWLARTSFVRTEVTGTRRWYYRDEDAPRSDVVVIN